MCEGRRDKAFVRDHAFGFDEAACRVDREHMIEVADVERTVRSGRAIAEEIGRILSKPNLASAPFSYRTPQRDRRGSHDPRRSPRQSALRNDSCALPCATPSGSS
jgi:hypothetical protein